MCMSNYGTMVCMPPLQLIGMYYCNRDWDVVDGVDKRDLGNDVSPHAVQVRHGNVPGAWCEASDDGCLVSRGDTGALFDISLRKALSTLKCRSRSEGTPLSCVCQHAMLECKLVALWTGRHAQRGGRREMGAERAQGSLPGRGGRGEVEGRPDL